MTRPIVTSLCVLVGIADLFAALFGAAMLVSAVSESHSEGEHWGLLGTIVSGGIALPVILVLLLVTIGILFAKTISWWVRLSMMLAVSIGFAANVAALLHAFGEPERHKQRFMDKEVVYTSGLHEALEKGDVARVRSILDSDPRSIPKLLHESDYEQYEPLHVAIQRNDRPMVELLLGYKIEDDFYGGIVNSARRERRTPLHCAVIAGNTEIVKLLLDHGADVNPEDDDHKTALVYAQEAGNQEIVKLLVKHGATSVDYERVASDAIEKSDSTRLKELFARGLVNGKSHGGSLLYYAASKESAETAEILLANGADINAVGPLRHPATPSRKLWPGCGDTFPDLQGRQSKR